MLGRRETRQMVTRAKCERTAARELNSSKFTGSYYEPKPGTTRGLSEMLLVALEKSFSWWW